MRRIFIGPLRHWLVLIGMLGILWIMGANQFHTSDFRLFLLTLIGLSIIALAVITLGYRGGERITRDPLDEED